MSADDKRIILGVNELGNFVYGDHPDVKEEIRIGVVVNFSGYGIVPDYIDPLVSIRVKENKIIINNGYHDYEFYFDEIDSLIFKKLGPRTQVIDNIIKEIREDKE